MCGIFSVLYYDIDSKFSYNNLVLNGNKISHRGPDSTEDHLFVKKSYNLFLMFHRLSINGLSKLGNQPMSLTLYPQVHLMCNGEIYNYKELALEYNINLVTGSDCEIIIHLYKKLGIDEFIHKLDGVFSFIIYDEENHKYLIGNDPIGIRSLYWSNDNNNIYVSSELKSLQDICINIHKFSPGTFIDYDIINKNMRIEKYYDINMYYKSDNIYLYNNDIEIMKLIKNKLTNSVKKRLISDREVGCLLSGGIDSSIIAYIANTLLDNKLKTFSIGLENSPDILAAEMVAKHLGTDHTSYIVSEKELLECIPETIKQIETYDITTIRASTPMYLLSKLIKEKTNIRVILSGEGADEASGSYLYFHNAPSPQEFQKECIRLINDVQHFDVLRGDKTTAGNGLEIRVPFFDKEFIDFYMSINPEKKIVRDNYEKFLLRKTFENHLPNEIIWRRKDGFSDGISTEKNVWYDIINNYINSTQVIDLKKYDYLPPNSSESIWYRNIFDTFYPNREKKVPYYWLPKWSKHTNPSGRLLLN